MNSVAILSVVLVIAVSVFQSSASTAADELSNIRVIRGMGSFTSLLMNLPLVGPILAPILGPLLDGLLGGLLGGGKGGLLG